MSTDLRDLSQTYYELSSLYKNPTRASRPSLDGKIAANHDAPLTAIHRRLFDLFKDRAAELARAADVETRTLYYKVLALLYEIDDYRGVASPSVADLIRVEWDAILSELKGPKDKRHGGQPFRHLKDSFEAPEVRSLWKAKVLCGVAAVEIRRKSSFVDTLLDELDVLESFVLRKLHSPDDKRPTWTMLAFVQAAQARVARQTQAYDYGQERLLSAIQSLDERAADLIEKLSAAEDDADVDELTDDLVFIRQKQTLVSLFNVGLANLQRGFLHSAEYACRSAHLQFRLHGQSFHRRYNELILLSIRRARTSTKNTKGLGALKDELVHDILPPLKPEGDAGNPKLYLYGLREKAVIQHYCGESDEVLDTLREMEELGPLSPQWNSRISILRARNAYRRWKQTPDEQKDDSLLPDALSHSEDAFKYATGLEADISSFTGSKRLLDSIRKSEGKSLIDAVESLIAYATTQLFLKNPEEAIKSADAVVALSIDDNPRLLAMGYLVLAEAHFLTGLHVEFHGYLGDAKALESRIDHKYVQDRRRAVEDLMPECLTLNEIKNFGVAKDLLMGWLIDRHSSKTSPYQIAREIGADPKTVETFLNKLRYPQYKNFRYLHLAKITDKKKKKK
ncbi:MAG: hypothetical protein ACJ74T_02885 [Pyrinomonadaceae bacterium]